MGVAVSVLLHATPLVVAGSYWAARPSVLPTPDAVFQVELFRLQAPPRPPSEQPPGPTQVEASAYEPQPRTPIRPRVQTAVATDVEPLILAPQNPQIEVASKTAPAPETTAPPSRPAPPAEISASAVQTWEGRLLAHLEHHKRYPVEARSRRQQGLAYVRFTMDREGRVLSAALERSSGYAALDREALSLLRRAQPLPAPPAERPGDRLQLSVPVDFFTRR